MFNWMQDYSTMIKATILAGIVVGTIIFTLLFILIVKPNLKPKYYKYFYAFTGGFLIVIGALGLFHEARERVNDQYHDHITGLGVLWAILIVLGTALLAGLIIWVIKSLIHPTEQTNNNQRQNKKWIAIILVLMHRIPASLAIGFLAKDVVTEWPLLLVIIIHIIPEVLLVYYRQRDMGHSRSKAFIISLLIKLIFFPMIILGAAIQNALNAIWWIQPCLFALAGYFMVYAAVIEIMPEFINFLSPHQHLSEKHTSSIKKSALIADHEHEIIEVSPAKRKVMFWLSTWLIFGLTSALAILMFHM